MDTPIGDAIASSDGRGVPPFEFDSRRPTGPPKGGTPNLGQGEARNAQFRGALNEGWMVINESPNLAPSIALLGFRNYRAGTSVAPEDLRAVYVRASDAEINEQWQRQKASQPA